MTITRGSGVMTDPTGHLEDAADSLLAAIAERAHAIGDGPLTLHWPLIGSQFDGGVLVIGQAAYGWYGDSSLPRSRPCSHE